MNNKKVPVTAANCNGKSVELNKLIGDLLDSSSICNSFKSYKLIGKISIHTYELTKRMSMMDFCELYGRVRSFVIKRSKSSELYRKKLQYLPFDIHEKYRKTESKTTKSRKRFRAKTKFRFFPTINVAYGIRLFMYYFDDIGTVKLIIDPSLVIASHHENFNPLTYDYTQIAERDLNFWIEVTAYVNIFIGHWDIAPHSDSPWMLTRIDATANIEVESNIRIPQLLYYLKRTIKRSSYHNINYRCKNQDSHIMECGNKSQRFIVYDKTYEQFVRYGRKFSNKILRFECKMLPRRIYALKRKLRQEKIIVDYRNTLGILVAVSYLAPFIMYEAICNVFNKGDFYSESAVLKILKKDKSRPGTKEEILAFMRKISSFKSYTNISKFIKLQQEIYGYNMVYRKLKYLQDRNISPILLEDRHTTRYKKFPSIRSIFLSAIINGYNTELSDELDYIRSFLPDLPDQ